MNRIKFFIVFFAIAFCAQAQSSWVTKAQTVYYSSITSEVSFIRFAENMQPNVETWFNELSTFYNLDSAYRFQIISIETDFAGFTHQRCQLYFQNLKIEGSVLIAHTKNNKVVAFNGEVFKVETAKIFTPFTMAVETAKSHLNLSKAMWEDAEKEAFIKVESGDVNATFYPQNNLIYVLAEIDSSGNMPKPRFELAYKIDIYAAIPFGRNWVYVSAINGKVITTENRIHETNVTGSAATKYAGTKAITTDSVSTTQFRLRETVRGNGIATFNMKKGKDYNKSVDFIDSNNVWNNVNGNQDEVAGDVHWGTEATYDFYKNRYNRNSIDNKGFALNSYVHFDSSYVNAFWDGSRMTYGDGNSTYSPLTSVDIVAHEITHGLTSNTANLIYSYESGALNESFSDIMAIAIEFTADSSRGDWTLGEDIISGGIRSATYPKAKSQPSTYKGQFWYSGSADNGGVHINSGVQNYWYYLLSQGGSGKNDWGQSFAITGIGYKKATDIAYRNLTYYMGRFDKYEEARRYSIESAYDLYGSCSQELKSTINAWYAVGVGNKADSLASADFTYGKVQLCDTPGVVPFYANPNYYDSLVWNFGNGTSSSQKNPTATYNAFGKYDVKLKVFSCYSNVDSITKSALVDLDSSATICNTVLMPKSGKAATITFCEGLLADDGGTGSYSNNTNGIVTIDPIGIDTITLQFTSFDFATNDSLIIFNGTSTSSPRLGSLSYGSNPNTFRASSGAVTIKQYTNSVDVAPGFALKWSIPYSKSSPKASFQPSTSNAAFNAWVKFNNTSTGGGQNYWDFGDGSTSMEKEPSHKYTKSGSFQVRLIVENCIGRDTSSYRTIKVDGAPKIKVAPTYLSDTLWAGDTASHYFRISNIGGGGLEQKIQQYDGHLNKTDSIDVLIFKNNGSNSNFKLIDSILKVNIPNCRKWVYDRNDHTLLKRYLSYCGAVIIVGNTSTYSVGNDQAILKEFVEKGGNVILISGDGHTNVIYTSGLITGSSKANYYYATSDLDTSQNILKGFPVKLASIDKANSSSISNTDIKGLGLISGSYSLISRDIGNGKAYIIGRSYETFNIWWNLLLSRTVEEGGTYASPWLVYSNDTAKIAPLDSVNQKVLFDATNLNEGNYTYNLRVSSNDTSKPVEIVTCRLKVLKPAKAEFKVDRFLACDGKFSFTNLSLNRVTRWKWFFGDGDSTFEEHPTHTYKKPGIYDVRLIVSNNSTTDTLIRKRYVNFDPSSPNCDSVNMVLGKTLWVYQCSGSIFDNGGPKSNSKNNTQDTVVISPRFAGLVHLKVLFNGSSSDKIEVYDYKGAYGGAKINAKGSYNGSFTSKNGGFLIVIQSANGANLTLTYYTESANSIHIKSDFIVSDTIIPFNSPVYFTDKSKPDSILYAWKYHFADGTFDNKPNTQHSYTKSGRYATYLVASSCHASDTSKVIPITIHKAPKMVYSPNAFVDTLKAGEIKKRKVLVKNVGDGPLVLWDINYYIDIGEVEDFNDTLNAGDSMYVNFILSAEDKGSANYTGYEYIGSNDTAHLKNKISATVHVLNNAFSRFDVDSSNRCKGTYRFINASLNAPKFIRWDFGDGYTSVEQKPFHTFNREGSFRVSLTVGDTGVYHTSFRYIHHFKSRLNCDKISMVAHKKVETNACSGVFYDNGGPNQSYKHAAVDTMIIRPPGGKSMIINFDSFNIQYNVYFSLDLYDGDITSSNKVASYRGKTLPNSGADIKINNGFATMVFFAYNDGTYPGFQGRWTAKSDTGIVSANFVSTDSVLNFNRYNRFEDKSKTSPKDWLWKFGDGQTSTVQNPYIRIRALDTCTTTLIVKQNCVSADSIIKKFPVQKPPTLSTYYPKAIFDTLGLYDKVTHKITLKNTGPGPLWAKISRNPFDWAYDTLHTLILTKSVDANILFKVESIIKSYYPASHLYELNTSDTNVLKSKLANKELVIVPTHTNPISSDFTAFGPALRAFVKNGGVVLFLAQDSAQSTAIFNTKLFSGSFKHFLKATDVKQFYSPNHTFTQGWSYTSKPLGKVAGYNVTMSDKTVFHVSRDYSNKDGDAGVIRNFGLGHAIIIGFDYSEYTDAQSKELYNVLDWLNARKAWPLPDWCLFNTDSAIAKTGDSLSFPIILNATETNQTIHNYEVPIMTNDLKMEGFKVPVQMVVRFDNDLKVDTILGTESGCALDTIWVKAVVSNLGKNHVPNYTLFYRINKGQIITQEVYKTIVIGKKDTFAFSVPQKSKGTGIHNIEVWLSTRGDLVYTNDTTRKTINSFELPKVLIKPDKSGYIYCWAEDSLRLNATPSGIAFNWSNGSTADYIRVKFTGITTLTGTDKNGCSNTHKVGTKYHTTPPAKVSIAGTHLICNNDSILISLNKESSYRSFVWSKASQNKNAIYAKDSGYYSVTVADSNNCKVQSDTIQITRDFRAKPIIDIDKKTPICDGEVANIWLTTGKYAQHLWTNGDTTSAIQVKKSETNSCQVVTDSGCIYTSNKIYIQVKPNPEPKLKSITKKEVCFGDSVSISTTDPFYFYLWSDGSYQPEMLAKKTGNYFVRVQAANGCTGVSDTVSLLVRKMFEPKISTLDSTICENESTVISLDTTYVDMHWNSGDTARQIQVDKAGKFNVVVVDDLGCKGLSNLIEISQFKNPNPTLFFSGDTAFCEGISQSVGIWGTYEDYVWSDSSKKENITIDTTKMIYVDVVDKNSCWGRSDSLQFRLEKYPRVDVKLSQDTICKGESVKASATAGYNKYDWGKSIPDDDSVVLNTSGTYYLQVYSLLGCTQEIDSFTIHNLPKPKALFRHTAIEKTFTGTNTSNNATDYIWFVNGEEKSANKNFSFHADSTGKYTVKMISKNRCYTDSFETEVYLSTLGIKEHELVKRFDVWPNPVKSIVHVVMITEKSDFMRLLLYDARGALLFDKVASIKSKTLKEDIDLSSFAEGSYWVVVKAGEQVIGMRQVVR